MLAIGFLVFAVVWAVLGYRRADRFLAAYGTNIGGASPAVWGFLCLMFGLIGYVALCIAERSATKHLPPPRPTSRDAQFEQSRRWTPPGARTAQEPTPYYTPLPNPAPVDVGRPNVGGSEFLPRR
jgi:hypothetical protein